jgi:hypothetical protein
VKPRSKARPKFKSGPAARNDPSCSCGRDHRQSLHVGPGGACTHVGRERTWAEAIDVLPSELQPTVVTKPGEEPWASESRAGMYGIEVDKRCACRGFDLNTICVCGHGKSQHGASGSCNWWRDPMFSPTEYCDCAGFIERVK